MQLSFHADRTKNVYHSLQEMRDFKKSQSVLKQVDEMASQMRYLDEGPEDWARTLPGHVIVSSSNLLSPYGIRFGEAELKFQEDGQSLDLTATLSPDDRKAAKIEVQAQQRGDVRNIYWQQGSASLRLEENRTTGAFTMFTE